MRSTAERTRAGWTRAQVLRAAVGGSAAAGGGALLAGRAGGSAAAAPSRRQDAEILRLFLTLESVQAGFYRAAVRAGRLKGEVLEYAQAALGQEREHEALLRRHVRHGAAEAAAEFAGAGDPGRFGDAAVELEELAIAAYIGQSGNLTRDAVATVAPMVSVEARQAAWIRDLTGHTPAPRAADPPRDPEDVLSVLRRRGYVR
jgi:ferritin-like protein